MSAASPTLETVLAYCRDARRVRGRFAGEFGRMHASLRELPTPAERESQFSLTDGLESAGPPFGDSARDEFDSDPSSWAARPVRSQSAKFVASYVGDSKAAGSKEPLLPVPQLANAFAARVLAARRDGAIRYDVRARLLTAADQLGIERFEANLIIARVEHRFQPIAPKPTRQQHTMLLIVALITQAVLITVGFYLFR